MSKIVVSAMYHFARVENYASLKKPLLDLMLEHDVKGTLLLAKEGINGTIAGSRSGIDAVVSHIKSDPRFAEMHSKESVFDKSPFLRTRVKLKKEIVTMGVEDIDPNHIVGTYVKPSEWNDLISDPEVLLVDTRNEYEYGIGTFKEAINPHTETFREFPDFVEQNLDPDKHKKVAMFCTGGIRCEKSTAFLKQKGFDEVYHLKGGILKYLEEVPSEQSLWQGECFVFDNRVSVNQELEKGQYDQCYACRMPITELDKQHAHYLQGVSCHHCHDATDEETKKRFQEREKQVKLAKSRGETHIGAEVSEAAEIHRQHKLAKKQQQQNSNNKRR